MGFLFQSPFQNIDTVFLKVNLIFRIKLGAIFAIVIDRDLLKCDSFLWHSEPGGENCSLQQISREERSEILHLHHHFLFTTTVTIQRRKIRG